MPQESNAQQNGGKVTQYRADALVALGSNLPSGRVSLEETVPQVIAKLFTKPVFIVRTSDVYRTPAFPAGSGPDFINAAMLLRTDLTPEALLDLLHGIEAEFGRSRNKRWGPRTLDLDLIAYENCIIPETKTLSSWMDMTPEQQMQRTPTELLLPHPRLQDRAFVLVPLNDIAPEWTHPLTGQSVRQMLAALPQADKDGVKRLVNPEDRL